MNCNFKTIEPDTYECTRCGYIIFLKIDDISKLRKSCQAKPGIVEKAGNLTKSMVKFAKDKFRVVSAKEQQRRVDICTGTDDAPKCEFFDDGSCEKCGCITSLKAKIESQSCPEGKW